MTSPCTDNWGEEKPTWPLSLFPIATPGHSTATAHRQPKRSSLNSAHHPPSPHTIPYFST
jgi:hypothetical protein